MMTRIIIILTILVNILICVRIMIIPDRISQILVRNMIIQVRIMINLSG